MGRQGGRRGVSFASAGTTPWLSASSRSRSPKRCRSGSGLQRSRAAASNRRSIRRHRHRLAHRNGLRDPRH
jgi:hypothetical protein